MSDKKPNTLDEIRISGRELERLILSKLRSIQEALDKIDLRYEEARKVEFSSMDMANHYAAEIIKRDKDQLGKNFSANALRLSQVRLALEDFVLTQQQAYYYGLLTVAPDIRDEVMRSMDHKLM